MEKEKSTNKSDTIDVPVGKYFDKFRQNPWIISTILLIAVLIVLMFFGAFGAGSENAVSGDTAANNLVSFIKNQPGGSDGEIKIVSSEKEGSLYKVTVDYKGQNIPVYVSMDGKYLIPDVVPLDLKVDNDGVDGNTDSGVSGNPVEVNIENSPSKGDKNAPLTIVEFSDYQCPFCGRFFSETLPLIEEQYIKTGKARLVFKDFPLSNIHPEAQKAAEAVRCVGEQKGDEGYFKMHDKLFENQASLSLENYKKWARELGVNGASFDKCLSEGKHADEVNADLSYGSQLGVTGTPAFFINGKLLSGAQPFSVFKQAIDAGFA